MSLASPWHGPCQRRTPAVSARGLCSTPPVAMPWRRNAPGAWLARPRVTAATAQTGAVTPPPTEGARPSAPQPAAGAGGSPSIWAFNHFAAGAVAGTIAALVMCPLEVVKTRMQTARVLVHDSSAFRVDVAMRKIVQKEGLRGLWRGVVPNVAGVAPARAVYFHVYGTARNELEKVGMSGSPLHLAAASVAGVTNATVMSPLWVVKTRLQIQTNVDAVTAHGSVLRNYSGVFDGVRGIYREEGFRGLFRGLSASYLGITESASQFMLYQKFKSMARDRGIEPTPLHSLGMAALAKLIASSLTYPHEVVRTRLRDRVAQNEQGGPRYTGLVQCFRRIAAEEGVRGLYVGLMPHLYKVVPNAAIIFCIVDYLLDGQL